MTSKVDLFEERLKAREGQQKDIFEERAALIQKKPSSKKDITKQAAIGAARGLLGTYGDVLDLTGAQAEEMLPGQRERYSIQSEILERMQQPGYRPTIAELSFLTDDDVAPDFSRLPTSESVEEFIENLGIETTPESSAGKLSRRIGEAIGGGLSFGAGPGGLGALGLGSAVGEGVERATESPTAGIVAEVLGSLAPSALGRKLAPGGRKAKELVEAARKAGLSEKEITPLIQSRRKLATLGKLARKGSKTQRLFSQIEGKLGDSYGSIKEAAAILPPLNESQTSDLLKGFGNINKKLRTTLKASPQKESAINFVQEAMENLRNRGANPEELISFWQDINQAVNWNAILGGKKSLAALKKPIGRALRESSPQLYDEFEQTNKLYARFKQASKALKPDAVDRWINKGETAVLALGLATGNPWILKKIGGEVGGRILTRELLINPRLQTLSNKMLRAIKNNQGATANRLLKQSQKILEKDHPNENWDEIFQN